MTLGVSVVLMAFNESANIASVVHEIRDGLDRLGPGHEILIVDDGSRDGTGEAADTLARELAGVRVLHHAVNGGLGAVYRTGLAEARADLLTFFPADGQFPATIVAQFLPLMADSDLVLGWTEQRDEPVLARLLSGCERALYSLLFGGFPRFRGILMLRRELLARIPLVSDGRSWVVIMELLIRARRAGARIRDGVPIPLRQRASGRSKVRNLGTIAANLRQVLALRVRF